MKYLTSEEIRSRYLAFFQKHQHKIYDSASLIPDDPTMLLTIAGMVPFKPFFLGQKTAPAPRVASCQKCIRTNDLENVGKTARHQTFFEMLGNFSFGDYFKAGAIEFAWEFITKELEMPTENLWVTVYQDDLESIELWHDITGISKDRIVKLGEKDNFWNVGPTGSCGPCSEIHIDLGEQYTCGPDCKVGCDCDRFLEIWNLVFTEFNRLEDGSLEPLPKKNIDTGMGLERLASVIQGAKSNFDTDLFLPIIKAIENIIPESLEKSYEKRVIADHVRAATFMISDGILPSNEGRGYILRKLIRRASTFARRIGYHQAFLPRIADVVIRIMGTHYTDLKDNKEYIHLVLSKEEEKFQNTLDQGLNLLTDSIKKLKPGSMFSGKTAFKLYDTYGFPYDLTEEFVEESGHTIDKAAYDKALLIQRENSKNSREIIQEQVEDEFMEELVKKHGKTEFVGYEQFSSVSKILHLINIEESLYDVIFDKTPFYAESGGQISDSGTLVLDDTHAEIVAVSKKQDVYIHRIKLLEGSLDLHTLYTLQVDADKRQAIARNHTAAHLIHATLRKHLGTQVHQAGSLVDEKRVRFDFTYFQSVSKEELQAIELEINKVILSNIKVKNYETTMDKAVEKGALAFFEDKYQEAVRVVEIDTCSIELCGGTHVKRTGDIGLLKFVSESGISSGVRRIEAITGTEVYKSFVALESDLDQISGKLKTTKQSVLEKIDKMLEEQKEREKEIGKLKDQVNAQSIKVLADKIEVIGSVKFFYNLVEDRSIDDIKKLVDMFKENFPDTIFVCASRSGEKVNLVIALSKALVKKSPINARDIIGFLKQFGINGGGRPDMVQAGTDYKNLTDKTVDALRAFIKERV